MWGQVKGQTTLNAVYLWPFLLLFGTHSLPLFLPHRGDSVNPVSYERVLSSFVSNSLGPHGLQHARLLSLEFTRQAYWRRLLSPSPQYPIDLLSIIFFNYRFYQVKLTSCKILITEQNV